jgi:nitrate reductase gamma subunit
MNNAYFDLLMWARGPGFNIALAIFAAGIALRVVEILVLGRKKDQSKAKGSPVAQGVRTIFSRSLPRSGMVHYAPVTYIGGYLFHLGFFVAFFVLGAHVEFLDQVLGFSIWWPDAISFGWPSLGRVIVESAVALSVLAMIALMFTRLTDPVRRAISSFDDYLVWTLTILPMLTGYIAVNKLFGDPTLMMALHILSVEALMVAFPFTKLMHAVTFVMSRYYNGAIQGRKGAES